VPSGSSRAAAAAANVSRRAGRALALEQLADCVRSNRLLLAEVVVDESGSLQQTDPQNVRVTATKAALANLANLALAGGSKNHVAVDVQLAGFSAGYVTVSPWTRVQSGAESELLNRANVFSTANRGV